MQDAPFAIGPSATSIRGREHPVGRFLLAGALAGGFFAVVADGLGVLLHVLGVMPLLP